MFSVWGGRGEFSVALPSPPPQALEDVFPTPCGWVSPLMQVVPYVTTIFGGLRAGKMVQLQGVVPLDARR